MEKVLNEGVLGLVRRLARTTVIDSSDSDKEKKEKISPKTFKECFKRYLCGT